MPAAGLVDAHRRTTVGVAASAYDKRTKSRGCSPVGCIPENTRDNSRDNRSRWACKGDLIDDDDEGCWIEYYLDEPQDNVEMKIAFYRAMINIRTLNVYVNGAYHSQIKSRDDTNGYHTFFLGTKKTEKLKLYLDDWEAKSDVWLSIKEVGQRRCGLIVL